MKKQKTIPAAAGKAAKAKGAYIKAKAGKEKSASNRKPTFYFGCLKGMIKMSPDFDDPLDDFKEYM